MSPRGATKAQSCREPPWDSPFLLVSHVLCISSFRGVDFNCAGISGDHMLVSIKDRPLIHAFAVHPRDRYHQKAVVGGVISALCTTKDGSVLFAAIGTQIFVWLVSIGTFFCYLFPCLLLGRTVAQSEDAQTVATSDSRFLVPIPTRLTKPSIPFGQ